MRKDMLNDREIDNEIEKFLSSYVVKKPDEKKIDETIDVLRDYMPSKKEKYRLLKVVKNQFSYMSISYFIASLLVVLLGVVLITAGQFKADEVLLVISPLPIIIGVIELARSKSEGTFELEKSFKHSYSYVLMARMIIISAIAAILNTSFAIALCKIDNSVFLQCMTSWIVPMCLVFSLALIIFHKTSTIYTSLGAWSVWMIFLVVFKESIVNLIENSTNLILVLMIAGALALLLGALIRFYKNEKKYEGAFSWN